MAPPRVTARQVAEISCAPRFAETSFKADMIRRRVMMTTETAASGGVGLGRGGCMSRKAGHGLSPPLLPAKPPRRPGPGEPMPDVALLEAIRAVLTASPFHGEGHRESM